MSDAERRALERRAEASGDVDDRARALSSLVREGLVPRRRVALAALLGDAAARALEPVEVPADLGTWARAVGAHGLEVCVRAGLAAARRLPAGDGEAAGRIALAQAACEAWLEDGARGDLPVARARAASDLEDGPRWGALQAPEELGGLRAELLRETAPPNAPAVRDLEPFCAATGSDDVAGFVVEDGRPTPHVAVVHLTWRGAPEAPGFPGTRVHPHLAAWVARELASTERHHPTRLVPLAAAWATAFLAAPGGDDRAAERLAAAATCAAWGAGDDRAAGPGVRAAIARALLPWALAPRA